MSEPTPGPWEVSAGRMRIIGRPGKHKTDIAFMAPLRDVGQRVANALLIAAAPELLLALKRAKELLECWDCGHSKNADCREGNRCPSCLVAEDADAAIAKATAR